MLLQYQSKYNKINNTDQCYFSRSDQTLSCTCFADFFSILYFWRNSLHFFNGGQTPSWISLLKYTFMHSVAKPFGG